MVLYLASLPLPALVTTGEIVSLNLSDEKHTQVLNGLACLLYGVFALPFWLPNPLCLIGAALHSAGKRGAAMVLLWIALVIALSIPIIMSPEDHGSTVRVGYFLWLASIAVTLAMVIRERPEPQLDVALERDA